MYHSREGVENEKCRLLCSQNSSASQAVRYTNTARYVEISNLDDCKPR